jgi:hypothetical protein
MTEGAVGQGRVVSDLNADIQIGAGGGLETVFIRARTNGGSNHRATVDQCDISTCYVGAYCTEIAESRRADLFRK